MAKVRRRSLQFHRYLADASLVRILYLRRRAMVMRYSWCKLRYVFRSLVTCLPWQSGDRAFQRHHKDQRKGSQVICLLQCHAHRTVAMRYDAISRADRKDASRSTCLCSHHLPYHMVLWNHKSAECWRCWRCGAVLLDHLSRTSSSDSATPERSN